MIYLTGDTHGGADMLKLSDDALKSAGLTVAEKDFVIVTGDFGFPFTPDGIEEYEASDGRSGEYAFWIKWLRERKYRILFVDGNHENHDWWREQPVTEMFGGRVQVHPHAENVIHLMRGEVYSIEGRTFFTFGGAASTDKAARKEGYSWWSAEEASQEETAHALDSLEKADFKVDHIITHTIPQRVIEEVPKFRCRVHPCTTARFLDTVLEKARYRSWCCGHFHVDTVIGKYRTAVFYNTVRALTELDGIFGR